MKINGCLRKTWVLASVSVIIGTLLRFLIARVIFLQPDEEIFGYDAYYFLLGRSFEFITNKIGAYIGYPFLLSIWFRIFSTTMLSARSFSVLCSAIFILFVYLTIKKIVKNNRYAFMGTLILAVLPFPLRYGHIVLSEPLAWAFLSASFFVLILAIEKEKFYFFALSGFISFFAVFVRRSALILLFIIIPTLIWTNRHTFKKIIKETGSWALGFIIPLAAGIGGFIVYFGWSKLEDMRWTRVPNVTPDWQVDLARYSQYDNALYTLQPITNKALPLVLLSVIALGIILMAIHRNRWKPVYIGAFLWPAMAAIQFHDRFSDLTLARIMILPIVVLFIERTIKRNHKFYLALSILLGSVVAFSTVTLPGDLWNVMMYTSVGAVVLIYLDDRMDSPFLRPILWFGGIISLLIIIEREPRIELLMLTLLPIAGMAYCLGSTFSKTTPEQNHLIMWGMMIPIVWVKGISDPWTILSVSFIIVLGILSTIARNDERRWRILSFILPIGSVMFAINIPESVPFWGIYLPILGTIIYMASTFLRSPLLKKIDHLVPITGAVMAFIVVYTQTNDLILSLIASVTVGSLSTVMRQLNTLSIIWKKLIDEKISVLLFMMVIGYLAFYIYYAWTEVYLTEFLLQATILGALLIWVFRSKIQITETKKLDTKILRTIKPVRIRRRVSVVFILFIIASIPLSINSYLETEWFREEPMDQRPYMRTMEEVGDWLQENTKENEKILAWHCYALEADRETIIETSNAKVYNAKEVIEDMETDNVKTFVHCFYTDHGLWKQLPFREYILSNFIIDEIIDGNECWKKV